MTASPRPRTPWPALLLSALLGACAAADDFLYEPRPDDPMDGYQGSLAVAGVNTDMDWGPKQDLLLSQYRALAEEHAKAQRRLEEILSENQNLRAKLTSETDSLGKEKGLRTQAEAEAELLRQKRRELEAQILGLSIEKAKLEQTALLSRIAELQRTLVDLTPAQAAEAAAPPRR